MEFIVRAALWLLAMVYALYDNVGRKMHKVWFWWNGGAIFWAAADGKLVRARPAPGQVCFCDFVGPDGNILHTLTRGAKVPTYKEFKSSQRAVHSNVFAITMVRDSKVLGGPPSADAEAGRVLYLRAAGISKLTNPRPLELVGLVEAHLHLAPGTLLPRVTVTLSDFSTREFVENDVVAIA